MFENGNEEEDEERREGEEHRDIDREEDAPWNDLKAFDPALGIRFLQYEFLFGHGRLG